MPNEIIQNTGARVLGALSVLSVWGSAVDAAEGVGLAVGDGTQVGVGVWVAGSGVAVSVAGGVICSSSF